MARQGAQLKKMLRRCSSSLVGRRHDEAEAAPAPAQVPPGDVPRGYFAVYVGADRSRYMVPVACLDAPAFQELLREAEDEFGFGHHMGITLPCDEATFHAVLAAAAIR